MTWLGLRHLKAASLLARAAATDPVEVWIKIQDELVERWEHRRQRSGGSAAIVPSPYRSDQDWESRMHTILGAPWPCPATSEFWALWPEVIESVRANGKRIGRGAFGGWADGDPGLVRAVWCLTSHLRPANVVETGVARGFTSRFILEALERNGSGHLWSIDLPPQLKPELHGEIGAAVANCPRHRWSYIAGSSRRRLRGLLSELGQIDLFIHDSRHSERNVRFELDCAWAALRPGGVVVADDIELNWGIHSFMQSRAGHPSVVCRAEPFELDPAQLDARGLFGIVQKGVSNVRSIPTAP